MTQTLGPSRAALSGARLSELARCPRMAALGALGAPRAEVSLQVQRYFARGWLYTAYVAEQFKAKHGAENIEVEREIPWPYGVGHADIYVKPEKLLVEAKSTVAPYSVLDDAILQAKLYLYFDTEAEAAAVYLVNPSSLTREDLFPVRLRLGEEAELFDLVEQLGVAITTGDLPPCVCSTPGQCRAKGCPYTDSAWEGWEKPPVTPLEDASLARRLAGVEEAIKAKKGEEESLKRERDELRAELREQLEPGMDYEANGVKVRRTISKPSERFSLSRARKAGIWTHAHDDLFGPFVSLNEGSERWYVSVDESYADFEPDFGEVPF